MRRRSLSGLNCSIAQTLDVVGDPWTLLIVRDAMFGTRRFEEFADSLDIPRTTLSNRLALLVERGVLERREYSISPPRDEYVLTDKGRALNAVLVSMLQWGDDWSALPEPPVTLVDAYTGEPLDLAYVDRSSGKPLSEVRVGRRLNLSRSGSGPDRDR